MVGRNWSGHVGVVRMLAPLPIVALLVPRLPLSGTFAIGGVLILWMAFASARIAINAHRAESETPPFRPTRRSR